ncbi:hypothetical protein Phum_PHUM189490 [Pediculus humanus corporis]|uniref:CUB domain-containing protein n=1 Tax=Pediculus humanus subsp. corporis TaxID=121224 RepID=E0VGM7_PEDHC|nr:uncharacterized protein Phum_PHUM189490 [Pediculus humanus corporis]EEB12533.1 hypothetical protein Phum_PHUM189490 [Pediculus humanus corporis]
MADVPHTLYSSGPSLILAFHTDKRSSNSSGFFGNFRFVDRRLFQTDGQKLPGTKCDYQFISSNYSLIHGKFYSPRYPSNYPKNVKCSYKFRGKFKERIQIVFEEVTLQKGDLRGGNGGGGNVEDLVKIVSNRVNVRFIFKSIKSR